MKKILIALSVAVMAMTTAACGERIKFNEAAVEVHDWGSKAGVQEKELTSGKVWYPPFSGKYMIKFPTTQQTYSFNAKDGRCFAFISKDQVKTVMCASMNVVINQEDADNIVRKYQGAIGKGGGYGLDAVVAGPVRREIQQAFAYQGVKYNSNELYADGGRALLEDVNTVVQKKFADDGIIIQQIMPNGVPILPPKITEAIEGTLQAQKEAARSEAQLAKTVADGAKRKADADADAYVLATEGRAIRENPEILRKLAIQRNWGLCPEGAVVCVNGADVVGIARTFDQDKRFK